MSRLRVSVTRHPRVLHHIVVSFGQLHAALRLATEGERPCSEARRATRHAEAYRPDGSSGVATACPIAPGATVRAGDTLLLPVGTRHRKRSSVGAMILARDSALSSPQRVVE